MTVTTPWAAGSWDDFSIEAPLQPVQRETVEAISNFGGDIPDLTSQRVSVIEFALSDQYLNRPWLYPRQGTLLKLIFLQDDLFTQYDYDVLGEWEQGFRLPEEHQERAEWYEDRGLYYEGSNGISPDWQERLRMCKAEGRPWFREVISVIGRRGSKGFLGAFCASYVLYFFILRGNVHQVYGIDPTKRLTAFVFSAKKEQAVKNQWMDIKNLIVDSPYFTPFVSRNLGEILTVRSKLDHSREMERRRRGVRGTDDMATFEILPKEATQTSGRGPASFMQHYDEWAWVSPTTAKSDAQVVEDQARPALDQFGTDAFVYQGSSPWQMVGAFYDNYQKALEIDPETRLPANPEMLAVQLTSWDPYKDWQVSERIDTIPPEKASERERPRKYCRHHRPIMAPPEEDPIVARLERANRENFRVERRSQWATVLNAYLDPDLVDAIFGPYRGERLEMRQRGILSVAYKAHGDPGRSGANFGYAIAHAETGPDGLLHCVFDYIHAWRPEDFEDNGYRINYVVVEEDIKGLLDLWMPFEQTFDQWNSASAIDHLREHVRLRQYPKQVEVYEKPANHKLNWQRAETFKTAMGMRLVHAPYHQLAQEELKHLQDLGGKVEHPTTGPIQTKDVADCMMECVHVLLGEQMSAFLAGTLGALEVRGGQPGGIRPSVPTVMPRSPEVAADDDPLAQLSNFSREVGASGADTRGRSGRVPRPYRGGRY